MWSCPVCSQSLSADIAGYCCPDNHRYDRAREGYTNLLLANQKRRPDPGDNADMLLARRAFLEAGWYLPLVEELVAQLARRAPGQLLDLGCGEGYYLAQMSDQLPGWHLAGVDISRIGIRMAAKRGQWAEWAVASSKRIPVSDRSIDALVSIFAPVDVSELQRVLRPGGCVLQVAPGPEHLYELKAEIYSEPRLHPVPEALSGFTVSEQVAVQFPMVFKDPASLSGLLSMTPLAYRLDAAKRAQLLARRTFTVQADFWVRVLELNHDA
ncbi:Ribosomal RNA large subunit methyltransferase A (rRNA (guanine-N(1)-)-methyltransferase) (23S rRNA m1G745 methyltransferase) [Simiduia agarivorans SA1 = DSM 21679]|uniref:Ribosomal RNA large subunit methyltransferase A (rRNA (guanine-N(1)-)-methyltransferase) (23S rRNA m1G745 methyltransferase) n=2 Tax=Simiduia TaxID=447467 RepID=K4KJD6_SIMAS|nr:Ribosomal RNA large subunit methyltransferase A (rRNA (guanine-N(1)-)-methyltransferase) (23S rRNA m1G745 methyltransferase) [Simiduia agarivorans SA1 = DSM 21679]